MARQISSCIILCMLTIFIFLYYHCIVTWKFYVNIFFLSLSFSQFKIVYAYEIEYAYVMLHVAFADVTFD